MATGSWAPFKELLSVVHSAISLKQPEAYYSLEATLKKHKPDFVSLLQNPAKNPTHRLQVQRAAKDGLTLPSQPTSLTLPQDFIQEALILSDILNINEFSAVELLLAGEEQQPRFPTLTRGLVAVLLYHDGRRNLVSTLRTLIQAREGVSWTLGLSHLTTTLVTAFTEDLFASGLLRRILDLLGKISVDAELERLSKGHAVGGPRHRQQLVELIEELRSTLADCLFYWACQSPLPKAGTLTVLRYLATVKDDVLGGGGAPLPATTSASLTPSTLIVPSGAPPIYKPLDAVTLSLLLTLFSSFNIGDPSETGHMDDSLIDEHFPIVADATFVPTVHAEFLKEGVEDWASPRLYAAVKFAWAVLLRECATRAAFAGLSELEDDEGLVDQAVVGGAFHVLRQCVVASQYFPQEEYYTRRLHWLVTSFIINMPLKVKELRNQGDEVAREMLGKDVMSLRSRGEGVSTRRRDFEEFMKLIGDLYRSDPHDLSLGLEYWALVDSSPPGLHSSIHHRTPQRQLSLFKFLHVCSDLLPALLFVPFMHMLTGLASSREAAYHCFSYLKANSPSLGGGGASAAISLDHFFESLRQYYLGLRREAGPTQTATGCAITPQELLGLEALMVLIKTIADLDESARVVMYENQTWLPVASLFGLIGCSVPRSLKANILQTLAAFARSPEIAASMWHTLELAQVLETARDGVVGQIGGAGSFAQPHSREGSIQVELEEIESQAEEYPLTRSFLVLLTSLLDTPIPPTLGAGHRDLGFDPYLEFVRDSVFLKFDSRAYRTPEEKWQVASLALEVLYKILSSHEISADDFSDQQPKLPGHTLLIHMMNDSQLLNKILAVLDEVCSILCDVTSPHPDSLAHTALLCLKMVENTLSREQEFLTLLRQYKSHVMVTPVDHLLLSINPRTGRGDYLVTIARYVSMTNVSPELALTAVQILYWSSQSHRSIREIVSAITSSKDTHVEVVRGFVEHLEWEDPEGGSQMRDEEASADAPATVSQVHRAVQLAILKLLSSCVGRHAPNIAHLLLGFETGSSRHVSEATLQDPGVRASPRTCLHSILSLIENTQSVGNLNGCHYSNPKLAELCYKLLYQLCADHDLSTPTLRYLRNNHDFFHTQLSKLPLHPETLSRQSGDVSGERLLNADQSSLLHQQAWLLKSVAVELRMTTLTLQRSHTQRLTNLLLSHPTNQITEQTSGISSSQYKSDFDLLNEGRRTILVLLDLVDFTDKTVPELDLQHFDQSAMERAVGSCETVDDTSGLKYADMKVLRRLLMNELTAFQGPATTGQKQGILEEIYEILGAVFQRNQVKETLHAHSQLFEAWRQLAEMVLHAVTQDGLKKELKMTVLFELIQDLLLKVEGKESLPLTTSVHGVVLTLLAHLRQTVSSGDAEEDASLLPTLYSGPLHAIMQGLVENILRTSTAPQGVRAYLYGSLLYYLMMTRQAGEEGQDGREASLWRPDDDHSSVVAGNLSVLTGFGEPLMDIVCRDACSGHDVARMLALSLLDAVVFLDWQGSWLKFMAAKGYLQTICASIQWEDDGLRKMLHPLPEALKALYIYESKMAFLTRVAHTAAGARELLTHNSLLYLSECRFIYRRPDHHGNIEQTIGPTGAGMSTGFIPSVSDRYQQIFLPFLKFILALLTCPGPQQKEACAQVTTLIGAHSDDFATVLKGQHPNHVSMATLQELALVTGIIGHSKVGQNWSKSSTSPLAVGTNRIQRLMLSLLPRFCLVKTWREMVREMVRREEGEGGRPDPCLAEEAFLLVQQISANVMAYCRVAMTMGGTEFSSPYSCILLTSDLSEAFGEGFTDTRAAPSQLPSLGLLIRHLREDVDGFFSSLEGYQQYSRKQDSATTGLTSEDVRQLLPPSIVEEKLTPAQQQAVAKRRLKQHVTHKKRELEQYTYIVENLLYVLWRHLQYYLVYCRPVDMIGDVGLLPGVGRSGMRRMQDTATVSTLVQDVTFDLSSLTDGVSSSDLEQLKTDVVKCLTDGLFKKLLDMEQARQDSGSEVRVGFVQALVRRIRRLLKLKAAAAKPSYL